MRGHGPPQTMELAADAIRGHKSAHSLATGPVMADPAQHLRTQLADTNMNMHQPPMHINLIAVQTHSFVQICSCDYPSPSNVCVARRTCTSMAQNPDEC